jgi:2-polyprenyl-3-methyl-5-hydroxy-6-metoxy-1,4-benzoquinol methylase
MIERDCPLCTSRCTSRLFKKQRTDYWRCARCRFRFATPAVNPNLVETLDGVEEAYLQYLAPNPSDAANFESLFTWMERHTALRGKRLLDVGAGSGKLVRFLRARGVDAHGIELSRALFERFLSGDAAFTQATFDDFRSSITRPFDVVTAFDVIEHVPDPLGFLRNVATALRHDGVFFASTPDVESLPARAFGRRWHFYHAYHLSYFAPRTFARAAATHGLELCEWHHRGRLRSAGYMVRYVMEFIAGIRAPAWACRFDRWCVPVNLLDTMYVVCRRAPD